MSDRDRHGPGDDGHRRAAHAMQAGVVGLTLALLGATAIAADPPAPPKPPPRPTGIAPKGDFTAGLARPEGDPGATGHDELSDDAFRAKAEAAAIRKSGVAAKRNGTRLILSSSGRPIVFDSVWPGIGGANESAFEDYRFDGLSPDREFYIVRATYYEGTNVLWVSRKDGTRHEMHGEARPSPDGSFIAMANASEAHDFNGILVWERAQGRLIERFRLVPSPDQPAFYRFMRWKDGRTVELEKTTRGDPITCPHANEETLVVLVRDGERWTLKDVSPPRCAR